MAMRSRIVASLVFGVAALMVLLGGGLFAVAGASFDDGACRDHRPDEWEVMNGNCADAALVMGVAAPFAVLGVLGMGLTLWGRRHA